MESVNTVRTSTVMVSRWVRQWSRITLIYPLLTMLFMLVLGGWSSEVFAAWSGSGEAVKDDNGNFIKENGNYFVVYDLTERHFNMKWSGGSYTYSICGPGATLTCRIKRSSWWGTGDLIINDGYSNLYKDNPSDGYEDKSFSVNGSAKQIKFSGSGGTYDKYFEKVKVTMAQYLEDPSATSLNFGEAKINSTATEKTVTIAWCNVPAMSYQITDDANGLFSVSVANNSEAGKYNTATFTVSYQHTKAGTHTAKLKITDKFNGYSKEINLSGTTNKQQPTITWSSNESFFNVDDVLSATSAPGTTVTLSSTGNESYVGCEGNSATMLAATSEKITITAHVAENEIYAAKDSTKEITITNLEKQHISWNQDFSRLKTTDGTKSITLNATSDSGLPVTYELVGDKTGLSLTQSGSVWTLTYSATECKNTTIVAKQGGNKTYAPASSVSKTVKVIDPTKVCDTNETLVNSTVTLKSQSTTYNIDIPSTMTIQVSRTKTGFFDIYLNGFKVEIYSGRNGTGDKLHEYSYEAGDINNSKTISLSNLNIAAKSVKLISDASNGYNVTSVTYTKQKKCTISPVSLSFETYPNTKTSAKTFDVTYVNYPISLECSNPKFEFSPAEFGDCDAYGTQTVSVTYTAGPDEGDDSGVIYIKDNTGVTLKTCSLTVKISKVEQSITSTSIKSSYNTTDRIELSAEANSGLTNFVYTASPEGVASFDGNVMTFSQSGTIAITATQPGSNVYASASTTVENVVVNKVTPTIATNPSVSEIKYLDNLTNGEGCQLSEGLATVTLRGVADTKVEGTFTWTNPGQVTTKQGSLNCSVTFTPKDGGMYNSKTFTRSVTISRADGSIEMNNGNVKVKVAGINDELDEWKIDLDGLVESKIEDAVANRVGTISFEVISDNKTFAAIDSENKFSATKVGTYTIRATQAETDYYAAATDEFTVTVNKLVPTIVFDNTDDPQVVYSRDVIEQPAYRKYNGKEVDRNVQYVSSDPSITGAIHVEETTLTARDVAVSEGNAVEVTVTASTTADNLYEEAENVDHHYAVYAKRSPHFTMDGVVNTAASKTLKIGETATITYDENTDGLLTIGKAAELDYVSYMHDTEARTITVRAQKGALAGDGVQTITLDQPGTDRLFPRTVVYTFTVKRNVSALSLAGLTSSMGVEDTIATPFTGLTNTEEAVLFSCSPEGSMKYEDGKLIALAAGTNTVTFSQPATEYWTGISQSKTITVSQKDPNMTTELSNRHAWYSIIEHPFKSLNTEKELQITSSNESLAKYIKEEDKIYVYGTSGNVTFTVNQEANYKYNAVVNYQKTFEIFQPNNRLPFTLTSGNLEDYNGGGAGSISWDDGGVVVGSTGTWAGPGNWAVKYIILKFVGVPDKLSFDFANTSSIATQYGWHFYESSNGSDWNLIKEYQDALTNASGGTSSGSESNLQLDPATQYIKLEYHGNYGGRYKNVHVTERKEITPRDATKDFGLGYNGNDPTMHAITVDWYNVKPCTVTITGTDADKFVLDEGSKTINSQLDHYGTVDLKVSYKHETNSETTHTATLHIEDADGNYYADVTLTGQTTPAPQTIIWRNDLTPMPIEGSFQNAAMVATGQTVTLESDHPEIVRVVDNTTLEPVSAGTARVTATAAGSTKWAETTDYMDIEVTTLKVQYITWTDNLSNRKREEGQTVNIALTATSSAGLPITYELDEDAQEFASISGNMLRLTGWGSGQVIAKQVGNEEYVAVQASKSLVSRNPNAKCRPLVGEYKDEYTLHTLAVKEIPIYGEPDSVTFWAKCDMTALWGMWVAEEYNGSYHDIQEISRTGNPNITSDYQHYSFPLHRNATAVKLYTKTGATMTRTFKNVEIPLAKYLELAENTMNFSQVDKGSTKTQSFYINYSNLSGVLDVEMENKENTQFTVVTTTVGEDCGDIAQSVCIDISCTGSTLGTENNKIIVSNKDQRLEIPVSATVVLPSQTITWNPEVNNVWTTDHVVLSATATSELPVSFTSGNTDIADVVYEDGVYSLAIKKFGDVAITAHQTGNENWSAATDKTLTYHISRVTPNILSYPTATGVVLPNTLAGSTLEGGSVDGGIAGTFRWQDATISVTKGVATYTAVFDPENDDYYETVAFEVEVEILKTPQTITWNRSAESEEWCANVIALDATASSGLAITYHSSDSTIAYAENGNLKVLKYGIVTVTAEQKGNDTYAAAENVTKTITLKRNVLTLPVISVTPVYVHHFLSNSTFPSIVAKAGNVEVGGTLQWKEPNMLMDNPGKNNCTAVFTPNNTNLYEPKECVLSVEVARFAPSITHNFTTEAADYGVKISQLVLNGSGSAVDGYDPEHPAIEGSFEWKKPNHVPMVRETSAMLVFRPIRSDWYDEVEIPVAITINSIGYIFTGDGEWGTNANWAEGDVPESGNDVVIQGNVVISSDVEVNNLTIEGGSTVTLTVDGVLTVNGESAERDLYGDVHVCNNGQLILTEEADLKINNFILDAQLGNTTNDLTSPSASGQLLGANKLDVNGDAFFQLAVDPCGHNTYGWYDFVVPFEVDVIGGISIAEAPTTPMQFNVNYAVMAYDESKRAVKGKDWNKFSGTMQPGRVYTISLDETQPWNTVIFKKKKGAAITGDRSFTTSYSGLGETKDNGWNGFGNGSLQHMELDVTDPETLVQIYDHANKCYQPRLAKDRSIAVGLSFFMQVGGVETIELSPAVGNDRFMAPTRTKASVDKFCLALKADEEEQASDYFWVSANEEATGEYVIGRDVLKMGALTSSKVARIWSNRNDINLCSNDIPMVDNQANCSISLFAPQAKTYTLSVENTPEDATLYLTYNDRIIWSLSASPYVMDLEAGTTEGYGLRIVTTSRMPEIATGVESLDAEQGVGMRKVMIDNKIYIITPEGAMYDVTGKILR